MPSERTDDGGESGPTLDQLFQDLGARKESLKARVREIEERERALDVRDDLLLKRRKQLDARRMELDEQEDLLLEKLPDLVERWSGNDEHKAEFLQWNQEIDHRGDEIREWSAALAQERNEALDRMAEAEPQRVDIERRRFNLKQSELNRAITQDNYDYEKWVSELLVHTLSESVWREIETRGESTTAWRQEMIEWLQRQRELLEDSTQYSRELDELNIARERWNFDGEKHRQDEDEFWNEFTAFSVEHSEWHTAFAESIDIDDRFRRRWIGAIRQAAGRMSSLELGIFFELFCVKLLETMGFEHVAWQGGGDDGGVDIWAQEESRTGDGLRAAVQCKFKGADGAVGVNNVILFHEKLPLEREHHRAIVMTFGRVEREAEGWGTARGVEFWDGERLCTEMVRNKIGLMFQMNGGEHELALHKKWWAELAERARAEHAGRKAG